MPRKADKISKRAAAKSFQDLIAKLVRGKTRWSPVERMLFDRVATYFNW